VQPFCALHLAHFLLSRSHFFVACNSFNAAMTQARELIRRNRTNGNGKDGRRVLARLDSSTSNSLLALRSRLNEEAKRRTT